jgi:ADP-ribosylglycohydrolase
VEQSVMTHLDSRCAAGALAVAGAVSLAAARQPIEADRFLDRVAGLAATADQSVAGAIRGLGAWVRLPPAEAALCLHAAGLEPASKEEWRGISAFVTSSVVWSLYAFLHTPDDYWATICTAIEVSGDTDTMAAIGGAISGAHLGTTALPASLVQQLNDRGEWGRDSLVDLAQRAARLVRR